MRATQTFVDTVVLNYALNAAWQLPVLFCAAWAATRMLRREGPAMEHRIWRAALFVATIAPAASAAWPSLAELATFLASFRRLPATAKNGNVTIRTGPAWTHGSLAFTGPLAHAVTATLLAVTACFALRLLWSMAQTRRLARSATPLVLPADAAARCKQLCISLRVRLPQIATNANLSGPVVLGVVQPLLLLPTELLSELSPDELTAAMAHELAHVQRRDFGIHLAMQVAALPLRWHPLVWLLLARIEQSREAACDAIAAEALQGPQAYARSLLKLAAWIGERNPTPNPHALGLFESGPLERRIMLLTERTSILSRRASLLLRVGAATLLTASCAAAMALHLGVGAAAAPHQASGPNAPISVKGGVMAGQILTKVAPVYPPDAKVAKVQGTVILDAVIAKDGTIHDLKVISGPEELQASAMDAVKQWVYKPYLLNGNPTEVETKITINYSLAN